MLWEVETLQAEGNDRMINETVGFGKQNTRLFNRNRSEDFGYENLDFSKYDYGNFLIKVGQVLLIISN